jgi:putative transposase
MMIEYAGAIYHVMSRGDRRENIFHDDLDRQDFLKRLAETCHKTGFQAHAYCLLPNHFHLVLETPNAEQLILKSPPHSNGPKGRKKKPRAEAARPMPWG